MYYSEIAFVLTGLLKAATYSVGPHTLKRFILIKSHVWHQVQHGSVK